MAQTVRNLPAMWETGVLSLGWKDSLEQGMATRSSILAWRILRTEEPWGWATNTFLSVVLLQLCLKTSDATYLHFHFIYIYLICLNISLFDSWIIQPRSSCCHSAHPLSSWEPRVLGDAFSLWWSPSPWSLSSAFRISPKSTVRRRLPASVCPESQLSWTQPGLWKTSG